jgi:hypothetical protein
MDSSVRILRELWRHRPVVAVFAVIAVLCGSALAYRFSLPPESRTYSVGTATTRILVDTPASQVIEVAPKGSDTLGSRSSLLSNLMSQGEVKAAIARRAGLRPDQLVAQDESSSDPSVTPPAPPDPTRAYVMKTSVMTNDAGTQLPIIQVDTQAPDVAHAAAIASAAVDGLRQYLDDKALQEGVAEARRLRVTSLGQPLVREATHGPGLGMAIIATMFIFGLLCSLLLLVSALVRGLRQAVDAEGLAEDYDDEIVPLDDDDEQPLGGEVVDFDFEFPAQSSSDDDIEFGATRA